MLDFRILGPLEVFGEDGPVRLGGPKQRATLAILLLQANSVVSIERLADDLYAGHAPVTAVTQVQRQVSELRKALGSASAIETRSPGYALRAAPEQIDLNRFERWTGEASHALEHGDAQRAAELSHEALALWRGAPLADFAYDSFAQTSIARLDELRLAALELRIEADLALGRHAELLGELEALVWNNPLRERPRGQLMRALYRSGRQAEALEVYRRTRETLVEQFGIEPSRSLAELERRILTQDATLDAAAPPAERVGNERTVLAVCSDGDRLDVVLSVAEPLASLPDRALIVARLLPEESDVGAAAAALNARRGSLAGAGRAAAFTSLEPPRDVLRLATTYDAELVLLDAPAALGSDPLPADLAAVLEHSPSDVAVVAGAAPDWDGGGVFVPFGGGEHDWAALEVGAWLAAATGRPLRLVGTTADASHGRRDASRLLADASLAVQRVVGVAAEPVLAERDTEALLAAVAPASVVVCGFPRRWRTEGLGAHRLALVHADGVSLLLVHRGTRPGGLAPRESRTRFSWSLAV